MSDPAVAKYYEDLANSIVREQGEVHSNPPRILYHYTSAGGMIGILNSRSIYITDLQYMNDLSELEYAKGRVIERLEEKEKSTSLSELARGFVFSQRVNGDFVRNLSFFSASFCEDGNLLSQWRAYRGKGGGYALGFDFFPTLPAIIPKCTLRRVVYDQARQAAMIDHVIDAFVNAIESAKTPENQLHHASIRFAGCIAELLSSIKHPDFREEREWRLVFVDRIDPRFDKNCSKPKFRDFDGNVIPYLEASFSSSVQLSLNDKLGVGFPIVELVIGPTINSELNENSTRMLLRSINSRWEPDIRKSGIPLRWL